MVEVLQDLDERRIHWNLPLAEKHLNLIPPISTKGYADVFELEVFDRPRKDILEGLSLTAKKFASMGRDPKQPTDIALPHIPKLFDTHKQIDLLMEFAEANSGFGNDGLDLVETAWKVAEREYRAYRSGGVEHFARIGETQVRMGLQPHGFIKADAALIDWVLEINRDRKPEYQKDFLGVISVVEYMARAKLRVDLIESAKQSINVIPWQDFRELVEEELAEDFSLTLL